MCSLLIGWLRLSDVCGGPMGGCHTVVRRGPAACVPFSFSIDSFGPAAVCPRSVEEEEEEEAATDTTCNLNSFFLEVEKAAEGDFYPAR